MTTHTTQTNNTRIGFARYTKMTGALMTLLALGAAFLSAPGTRAQAEETNKPPVQQKQNAPNLADILLPHDKIGLPDLIVGDIVGDYTWNGSSWVRANSDMWVQVYNQGTAAANPSLLRLQWNQNYWYQQGVYNIPLLKPGEGFWVKVYAQMFNPTTHNLDTYNLWAAGAKWDVKVDCTNLLKELDENNNTYSAP